MLKREEAIEKLKEVIEELEMRETWLEEYHPITSKKIIEVIEFLES